MNNLKQFAVQFIGMKDGLHELKYNVDDYFFQNIEDSIIKGGDFDVTVYFEKQSRLFNIDIEFSGKVSSICDRCLAEINLPVSGSERIIVKFSEEPRDEMDIVYLPMKAVEINLAKYIYEFIALSLPFTKIYDCENDNPIPCDMETLAKLQENKNIDIEQEEENQTNPIWDSLKNKFDN